MLVLGRKIDERVTLTTQSGEVITVMVVDIRGETIRLGFEADRSVRILRGDAIRKEPKQ